MGLSAIASFASFTAVLTESLATIGLSSITPTLIAVLGKELKCAFEHGMGNNTESIKSIRNGLTSLSKMIAPLDKNGLPMDSIMNVIENALQAIAVGSKSIESINIMVPKTADIDASFEFHANESYQGEGQVGCMVEVVTLKAGMSALYSAESSNKVNLKLHFESIPVDMRCDGGSGSLMTKINELAAAIHTKNIILDEAQWFKLFSVKNTQILEDTKNWINSLSSVPSDVTQQLMNKLAGTPV